jgi:hypothetical protein
MAELAKAEVKRLQARQKHFEATAERVSSMVLHVLVIDHLKSSFSELCRYSEARRHHPRRRRKSSVNHQHGH